MRFSKGFVFFLVLNILWGLFFGLKPFFIPFFTLAYLISENISKTHFVISTVLIVIYDLVSGLPFGSVTAVFLLTLIFFTFIKNAFFVDQDTLPLKGVLTLSACIVFIALFSLWLPVLKTARQIIDMMVQIILVTSVLLFFLKSKTTHRFSGRI